MTRICRFNSLCAACMIALVVELVPAALCAQIGEPVQERGRPLIVLGGIALPAGTAAEQDAVFKLLRPAIESIAIIHPPAAVQRFGDEARDGVVLIRLKHEAVRAEAGGAEIPVREVDSLIDRLGVDRSEPLIVIDGVIVPTFVMNGLGPEDIERIEVLKGDAAVARFGERARGGAIQITTRKQQL